MGWLERDIDRRRTMIIHPVASPTPCSRSRALSPAPRAASRSAHSPRLGFPSCLLVLWLAAGYGGNMATAQTPPTVLVLPSSHQTVDLALATGRIVGGHHGGQHEACGGANRAFLALLDTAGQEVWHLAQPPRGATCGDPIAASPWDDFNGIEDAHVVSSRLHDAALLEGGDIVAIGDLRLAWQDAVTGQLEASTVAFAGRWDLAGVFVQGHLFGTLPDGPASPGGPGCTMVCSSAEEGGDALVASLLVVGPSGVTLGGWWRPSPDGGTPRARDLWVARLDAGLDSLLWTHTSGTSGDDEAVEMVVDDQGWPVIAGIGQDDPNRFDHEVTLSRLDAAGLLDRRIVFGGPLDDRPKSLTLEPGGSLVITGDFEDQIDLAGQSLGAPGLGKQGFRGELDPALGWISAQILSPPGQGGGSHLFQPRRRSSLPRPVFGARSGDNHPAIPIAYEVVTGSEQGGQLAQIEASDNDYLRIVADTQDSLELRVLFDPDPMSREALYLDAVRVELGTLFCYHARVLVKGMVSEEFVVAGERSLCPADEPILEIQIPEDFSNDLGYDGSTYVDPQHRLVVAVEVDFQTGPPAKGAFTKETLYAGAEEDASVDHIEVIVEY